MPGMDGTGPMGLGPRTGRAYGLCSGSRSFGRSPRFFRLGYGLGGGYNRSYGRGFCRFVATDSKEALTARNSFFKINFQPLKNN